MTVRGGTIRRETGARSPHLGRPRDRVGALAEGGRGPCVCLVCAWPLPRVRVGGRDVTS